MKNKEIANLLYEIADFLEAEGSQFKPFAYRKAAFELKSSQKDVKETYEEEGLRGLEDIPGIGKSIAEKIEEYIKKGRIKEFERLKKKTPIKMKELVQIGGMGPKKAKLIYEKLGVSDVKSLEKAAKENKISKIEGFGEKSEKNILESIGFLKKSSGRFLTGEILEEVKEIEETLKKSKNFKRVALAGSLRRGKETVGDIDILAVSDNPGKAMDFFASLPGAVKVWSKGKTKSSLRMSRGFDVDLRIVPERSFGAALQYFTGSKEHNIALRKIAASKGFKLSEYGLFKKGKMVAGRTEEGIYRVLGMEWTDPEIRENQKEIGAAINDFENKKPGLPRLIEKRDIKGDLHCHSVWNGGRNDIWEMAESCIEMGYEFLGISDHTKFLKIEKGLDEKELEKQGWEIRKINEKIRKTGRHFRILQGAETNILKDGSIDIKNEALKKLDYAIAGIHSNFKMSKREMTERIIKAMKNRHINIISHPTGRLLQRREPYEIDFDKILRAAKIYNVALEINSFPERLDLDGGNVRRAKEAGVKMAINTDSHQKSHLKNISLGVSQAKRGWAEKKDIINAWSPEKMMEFFKKKHAL